MAGDIGWLNSLPPDRAVQELLACCASRQWAQKVAASRPYPDTASATAAAVAAVCELSWPDVEEALSAHPRIGDRAKAELSEREAEWSRGEQSGAATADAAVRAELAAGNRAYEDRFGHVFLIRATGRSAEEMLTELRKRLANSLLDERIKVQGELADITRLRVRKLLGEK
ncbi:2-oxo-4-hydroxy-4-carboxy-5-ureidoimidazoline decarboxylase [Nocardia ninae]|uniref:2-oxo-4-hydroxy-4-carboxy-5-ureidoimidazoline decarboxylase n=1 Tax=Nocardia ninae NBRC 108245 TaxID=1210091 RepID=A0A511MG34_9NOCA|nr:2-oxo-4-hydroxy-4-carboxy-5-ureidoimidazoline decarboxylase [Nocardia ninae]GEM39634.1 2-oxo-4-hydroxy-4-carboxy-5-ureidoimidazoline decarboxylase [Nocardia ninae NBRC 108245]